MLEMVALVPNSTLGNAYSSSRFFLVPPRFPEVKAFGSLRQASSEIFRRLKLYLLNWSLKIALVQNWWE